MPCKPYPPRPLKRVGLLVLLLLSLGLIACEDRSSPPKSDPQGLTPASSDAPTIVSLTPAITQMLIDMGKRDQIIGISRDDDPQLGLPVCGTYNDPVLAKIIQLKPDLVLTESVDGEATGVPPLLRSYAADGVFRLGVLKHSESIADIQASLVDPQRGLGVLVGDVESAERASALMGWRLNRIAEKVKDAPRPRVLMLLHPETLGVLGTGVTHAELLELAGAANAAQKYRTGYLSLTRTQVLREARPDVVLIFEANGRPLTDNDSRLAALKGLDIPAMTNNRIVVINHPQAMLPSTALPEVLKQMAKAVHPDRAEAIDRAWHEALPSVAGPSGAAHD